LDEDLLNAADVWWLAHQQRLCAGEAGGRGHSRQSAVAEADDVDDDDEPPRKVLLCLRKFAEGTTRGKAPRQEEEEGQHNRHGIAKFIDITRKESANTKTQGIASKNYNLQPVSPAKPKRQAESSSSSQPEVHTQLQQILTHLKTPATPPPAQRDTPSRESRADRDRADQLQRRLDTVLQENGELKLKVPCFASK